MSRAPAFRPKRERWTAGKPGSPGPRWTRYARTSVHHRLSDLRLRDPRLLDRLPEPALQEAVEVLARVPHVDDREAVVGGAGGMERLAFPEHTAARSERPHHGVVLLDLTAWDVDYETHRHVPPPWF